jgi:hypothetical protein
MNFVSDAPAPGQVDPKELTANQLTALRTVQLYKLGRVKNGWRAPWSPLVTLATMQVLGAKRLVMRRDVGGSARMEITGTGINTLAVADSRKRSAA